MPASALNKVVTFAGEMLFERTPPTLTKPETQVLKSPNKSTMIDDFIKNYSQKNVEDVDYYPAAHRDSETHALKKR